MTSLGRASPPPRYRPLARATTPGTSPSLHPPPPRDDDDDSGNKNRTKTADDDDDGDDTLPLDQDRDRTHGKALQLPSPPLTSSDVGSSGKGSGSAGRGSVGGGGADRESPLPVPLSKGRSSVAGNAHPRRRDRERERERVRGRDREEEEEDVLAMSRSGSSNSRTGSNASRRVRTLAERNLAAIDRIAASRSDSPSRGPPESPTTFSPRTSFSRSRDSSSIVSGDDTSTDDRRRSADLDRTTTPFRDRPSAAAAARRRSVDLDGPSRPPLSRSAGTARIHATDSVSRGASSPLASPTERASPTTVSYGGHTSAPRPRPSFPRPSRSGSASGRASRGAGSIPNSPLTEEVEADGGAHEPASTPSATLGVKRVSPKRPAMPPEFLESPRTTTTTLSRPSPSSSSVQPSPSTPADPSFPSSSRNAAGRGTHRRSKTVSSASQDSSTSRESDRSASSRRRRDNVVFEGVGHNGDQHSGSSANGSMRRPPSAAGHRRRRYGSEVTRSGAATAASSSTEKEKERDDGLPSMDYEGRGGSQRNRLSVDSSEAFRYLARAALISGPGSGVGGGGGGGERSRTTSTVSSARSSEEGARSRSRMSSLSSLQRDGRSDVFDEAASGSGRYASPTGSSSVGGPRMRRPAGGSNEERAARIRELKEREERLREQNLGKSGWWDEVEDLRLRIEALETGDPMPPISHSRTNSALRDRERRPDSDDPMQTPNARLAARRTTPRSAGSNIAFPSSSAASGLHNNGSRTAPSKIRSPRSSLTRSEIDPRELIDLDDSRRSFSSLRGEPDALVRRSRTVHDGGGHHYRPATSLDFSAPGSRVASRAASRAAAALAASDASSSSASRLDSAASRASGIFRQESSLTHDRNMHNAFDMFQRHFAPGVISPSAAGTTSASAGTGEQAPDSAELVSKFDEVTLAASRLNTGLRTLIQQTLEAQIDAEVNDGGGGSHDSAAAAVAFARIEKGLITLLKVSDEQVRSLTDGLICFTRADRERERMRKAMSLDGGSHGRPASARGSGPFSPTTSSVTGLPRGDALRKSVSSRESESPTERAVAGNPAKRAAPADRPSSSSSAAAAFITHGRSATLSRLQAAPESPYSPSPLGQIGSAVGLLFDPNSPTPVPTNATVPRPTRSRSGTTGTASASLDAFLAHDDSSPNQDTLRRSHGYGHGASRPTLLGPTSGTSPVKPPLSLASPRKPKSSVPTTSVSNVVASADSSHHVAVSPSSVGAGVGGVPGDVSLLRARTLGASDPLGLSSRPSRQSVSPVALARSSANELAQHARRNTVSGDEVDVDEWGASALHRRQHRYVGTVGAPTTSAVSSSALFDGALLGVPGEGQEDDASPRRKRGLSNGGEAMAGGSGGSGGGGGTMASLSGLMSLSLGRSAGARKTRGRSASVDEDGGGGGGEQARTSEETLGGGGDRDGDGGGGGSGGGAAGVGSLLGLEQQKSPRRKRVAELIGRRKKGLMDDVD